MRGSVSTASEVTGRCVAVLAALINEDGMPTQLTEGETYIAREITVTGPKCENPIKAIVLLTKEAAWKLPNEKSKSDRNGFYQALSYLLESAVPFNRFKESKSDRNGGYEALSYPFEAAVPFNLFKDVVKLQVVSKDGPSTNPSLSVVFHGTKRYLKEATPDTDTRISVMKDVFHATGVAFAADLDEAPVVVSSRQIRHGEIPALKKELADEFGSVIAKWVKAEPQSRWMRVKDVLRNRKFAYAVAATGLASAAGCIMYEMMTGEGESESAAAARRLAGRLVGHDECGNLFKSVFLSDYNCPSYPGGVVRCYESDNAKTNQSLCSYFGGPFVEGLNNTILSVREYLGSDTVECEKRCMGYTDLANSFMPGAAYVTSTLGPIEFDKFVEDYLLNQREQSFGREITNDTCSGTCNDLLCYEPSGLMQQCICKVLRGGCSTYPYRTVRSGTHLGSSPFDFVRMHGKGQQPKCKWQCNDIFNDDL